MMEDALAQLQTNFSVELLDTVVVAAYDPANPQRAAANKVLMAFQGTPDVWTKADAILETSTNPQTKFFALQILDEAIRTR
jgi:exportin-1